MNPEIIEASKQKELIREGCISFLEFRAMVPRYPFVKVRAFNRDGEQFELEDVRDFAMLLQHELDHLDGVLYIDHLKKMATLICLKRRPSFTFFEADCFEF